MGAWELSVRAFSSQTAEDVAASVAHVLQAECTCFERVELTGAAYSLVASGNGQRERLAAWRQAVLRNAWRLPPALGSSERLAGRHSLPADGGAATLLYVHREHATRAIVNEAALARALAAAHRGVVRVVMDRMPLAEQMQLASSSAGLIGVFGQALTWAVLLPSERRRTALVEIMADEGSFKRGYAYLCDATGVRYYKLHAQIADRVCLKPTKPPALKRTALPSCRLTCSCARLGYY